MKKISLGDVANSLGVSKTLVSFVINGRAKEKGISKVTAEKVMSKVKELGYHPNNFARVLRTGKSMTIGVVVADISNAFYARICKNIEDYCSKNGYNVFFCSSGENPKKEKSLLNMLYERGIDGLIVSPTRKYSPELEREFNAMDIPIVLIDRYFEEQPYNYVVIDNYKISKKITQKLVDLGHKNIGFLAIKPLYTTVMQDRLSGYKDCLKENNIPFTEEMILNFQLKDLQSGFLNKIKTLFEKNKPITALISSNNKITLSTMEYLMEENIKIPDDLSFISFDFLDAFKILNPPLSSVQLHAEIIGDKSAEMLLNKIKKPHQKIANIVIEATFHERKSCKSIN